MLAKISEIRVLNNPNFDTVLDLPSKVNFAYFQRKKLWFRCPNWAWIKNVIKFFVISGLETPYFNNCLDFRKKVNFAHQENEICVLGFKSRLDKKSDHIFQINDPKNLYFDRLHDTIQVFVNVSTFQIFGLEILLEFFKN